jgi:hypothetical protein
MVALDMTPLNAALSHWVTALEGILVIIVVGAVLSLLMRRRGEQSSRR